MSSKKGFTLVELSLATAFLAVLLLMIATIVISTAAIFQKGISLRNVNATGRSLIDDLTRSITSAPLKKIPVDEQGKVDTNLYFRQRTGTALISRVGQPEPTPRDVQYSGTFCSGKYSYIWNTGYVLDGKRYGHTNNPLRFEYHGAKSKENFYLLKVPDPNRSVCAQEIKETDVLRVEDLDLHGQEPEEMLTQTEGQLQLAIYELTIFPVMQDAVSWRSFYTGTFVLSTLAGDVDIRSSDNFCDPDNSRSLSSDFSYCAVNKFNFSAQASGQAD